MHPEKFEVDKIQNGRLSAIIHLDRPDIVEYLRSGVTIASFMMKVCSRWQMTYSLYQLL